jgi:hypothetical protein
MALIECKKCGQPVSDKADFCSVCGAPVGEENVAVDAAPQTSGVANCAECGNPIPDGALACVNCGAPVASKATPVSEPIAPPLPSSAYVIVEQNGEIPAPVTVTEERAPKLPPVQDRQEVPISKECTPVKTSAGNEQKKPVAQKETVVPETGAQEKIGVSLTESNAIIPSTSVCALLVAHPQAKYFDVKDNK